MIFAVRARVTSAIQSVVSASRPRTRTPRLECVTSKVWDAETVHVSARLPLSVWELAIAEAGREAPVPQYSFTGWTLPRASA